MAQLDSQALKRCAKAKGDDVLIKIEVKPGSRSQGITRVDEWRGCLEVSVKARAEKGAANCELINVLSSALSVPHSDIAITRGRTSPRKEITISGLSVGEFVDRLRAKT